jgi:putative hydrolase of the HAD superfamily
MSITGFRWHDADRMDLRIEQGRLRRGHLRGLARELARLHAEAPTAPEESAAASPGEIGRRLHEDLEALSQQGVLPARMREALKEQKYEALTQGLDAILDRSEEGHVRGVHGALRPERVWLRGRRRVRFSTPSEAAWGDTCEDLAPLTVLLRAAARSSLAETFLASYARYADDYSLYRVIDVYELVAACRLARRLERAAAMRMLAVAEEAGVRVDSAGAQRPLLVVMTGAVASGKTTLAKALTRKLVGVRVINDRVREAVLEPVTQAVGADAALERMASRDFDQRVYAEVFRRAKYILQSGRPCVLDGCYPDRSIRQQVAELAESCDAQLSFVRCQPSPESMRMRLAARDDRDGLSEGSWLEIATTLEARIESIADGEAARVVTVDTDLPASVAVETIRAEVVGDRYWWGAGILGTTRLVAVTFDCWNTLLVEEDWHEAHRRRVDALLAAALEDGATLDYDSAGAAFDRAWSQHMERWRHGEATGAYEVARWSLEFLGLPLDPLVIEHLVASFEEASHSGRVIALEGARETLSRLQGQGVAIALICDTGLTPGRVVRRHLERLGLLEPLSAQIFSDEVGIPKPHARIFRAALDALGVKPEETVHVGDLLRNDIGGARALGMRSVRIRCSHDDREALPEADGVADSHAALQRLLGVG